MGRTTYQLLPIYIKKQLLIATSTICPVCNQEDETINHLLFICPNTQQLWHHLGLTNVIQLLGSNDIKTLLHTPRSMPHNLPAKLLWPYALWHIWNCRNKNIFENRAKTPNLYSIISQAAEYYDIIQKGITRAPTRSMYVKCCPPSPPPPFSSGGQMALQTGRHLGIDWVGYSATPQVIGY